MTGDDDGIDDVEDDDGSDDEVDILEQQRQEQIRVANETVERTIDVMRNAIDVALEVGSTYNEAHISLRDEFMHRGVRRIEMGDYRGAQADYANYCAVIMALVEARDQIEDLEGCIAIRDALIEVIDADVIKVKGTESG